VAIATTARVDSTVESNLETLNRRISPMKHVLPLLLALAVPMPSIAHPIEPVPATDPRLRDEIAAFRKAFQAAGASRDAAALRRYYTDDFTHTHTSGKVDGKDARIVSVVAGEQTVETAPVPEFHLSCFG
jgi:hypothetical protein